MSLAQTSLLEAQGEPVLIPAIDWITSTFLGSLAIGLSTIAVAIIGVMMFEGRLPVRRAAQVILGCFTIFGAPVVAAGLLGVWQEQETEVSIAPVPEADPTSERIEPPPANYDPYSGASFRNE